MIVSGISSLSTKKPAFKGDREDINNINVLTKGESPILPNKKLNILAALNSIAKKPTDENLEFLMGTAQSLRYGVKGNSQFADSLNQSNPDEKQNTNWDNLLKTTIENGLKTSTSQRKHDLESEFAETFAKKIPLSAEEKKLLKLKNKILLSSPMTNIFDDSEKIEHATNISQNLDYFLASSEIPMNQKLECMQKFNYFLSDKYNINQQLKDKKLQAMDEVLNDLLIETPKQKPLLIKGVNQRQSGMCAAISISRKAMAYEYKPQYLDIIFDELSDSDTMHVYDVTKLDEGKKVPVKKTYVDFNDAFRKGYRLIDASAHQWMHMAGTISDGTSSIASYTPFDNDNYEIFKDSFWYNDLSEEFQPSQQYLRHLIKERDAVEAVEKTKKSEKKIQREIGENQNSYVFGLEKASAKIKNYIQEAAPQANTTELQKVTEGIIKLAEPQDSQGNDKKIVLHSKESKDIQKATIAKFVTASIPSVNKDTLNKNIDNIFLMYQEAHADNEALKKLKNFNTKKGKYTYNKKLYTLAATHRQSVLAQLNVAGNVAQYENSLKIPPRETQVLKKINRLSKQLDNNAKVDSLAQKLNVQPTKDAVQSALNKETRKIEVENHLKIDSALQKMSMGNRATILNYSIQSVKKLVDDGDKNTISNVAQAAHIPPKKEEVSAKINSYLKNINDGANQKQLNEMYRILGYDDEFDFAAKMFQFFIQTLNSPMDQKTYNEITSNIGSAVSLQQGVQNIADTIFNTQNDFNNLQQKLDMKSREDVVLSELEKSGFILSKPQLDNLKDKFDADFDVKVKEEKLKDKGVKVKPDKSIYKFTPEQLTMFDSIDTNFPKIKKYANSKYKLVNAYLKPELDALYDETGKLRGSFWIGEEGTSGLFDNQSIRIFEQMTGKPYHNESNIDKIVDTIKKGDGSGTSSTQVSDTEYSGHAQYVAEISPVELIDEKTKEKVMQDVLWHDNSWGKAEEKGKWLAEDGQYHTDYEDGYGGHNGYIFSDKYMTGTPIVDLKSRFGTEESSNEKYPLFNGMRLQGFDERQDEQVGKVFNKIFTINSTKSTLDMFEKLVQKDHINIKALESLDSVAEFETDKYFKRIENELTSKEKYDALSENDPLKLMLKKLAVYEAAPVMETKEAVTEIQTNEDLENFKKELFQEQKNYYAVLFNKVPESLEIIKMGADEDLDKILSKASLRYNLKLGDYKEIKDAIFTQKEMKLDGSLDSIENVLTYNTYKTIRSKVQDPVKANEIGRMVKDVLVQSIQNNVAINSLDDLKDADPDFAEIALKWIDKKYNPRTDEDAVKIIQNLQNMKSKDFKKILDEMTEEDAGINYKHPYEYVQRINAQNHRVTKVLEDIISYNVITKGIREIPEENINEEDPNSIKNYNSDILYRNLYISLTNLDTQKYINRYKGQMFEKYQVRPAFSDFKIFTNEELSQSVNEFLSALSQNATNIKSRNYVADVVDKFSHINGSLGSVKEFNTPDNYENAVSGFSALNKMTKNDSSVQDLTKQTSTILKELQKGKGNVDNKVILDNYAKIKDYFKMLDAQNVNAKAMHDGNSQLKKQLDAYINQYTELNVRPKYRDDVNHAIREWMNQYAQNPRSKETAEAQTKLTNLAIKRHITTAPIELLHEYTNTLQNGNNDKEKTEALRHYMDTAMKAANLASVEYRLVKNENCGLSSKTANYLDKFGFTLSNGKYCKLNTDTGLQYLIQMLQSDRNNNSTLKIFFAQTGLSEKAAEVIMKTFKPQTVKNYIKETEDTIISSFSTADVLNQLIDDFVAQNNIQYPSYKEASAHLLKDIDNKFEAETPADQEALNAYKAYMEQVASSDSIKEIAPKDALPALMEVHNSCVDLINQKGNASIAQLNDVRNVLKERINLLEALYLSPEAPIQSKIDKFYQKISVLNNDLDESITRVNSFIQSAQT
ncbi:MAG: hypothetical protein PHV37_01430 [Candidatus Gastranaerophilales bacterium]|nr:hypothetical protein [Candidatus Gastranaerophilales bacterium]